MRILREYFCERKGLHMISSTANSRVKQVVQWQKKAGERKKDGIFIAEGMKMYAEAPADGIRETYISTECLRSIRESGERQRHDVLRKLEETGFEEVSEEVLGKMSDTQSPQGILCVLSRPFYTMEEMLHAEPGRPPLLLLLEDLQDPGNLGTILRTGEGAGISGVIMSRDTADIYNPKTVRATMGSVFRVPHIYTEDLGVAVKTLTEAGVHVYAAHLKGKAYYDTFDFRAGTAFLIGNEGNGLREETADLAQQYIKIPMEGQVESLNAAVSAALLVYEAHRQRMQNGC